MINPNPIFVAELGGYGQRCVLAFVDDDESPGEACLRGVASWGVPTKVEGFEPGPGAVELAVVGTCTPL